jgi:hypothetical protein
MNVNDIFEEQFCIAQERIDTTYVEILSLLCQAILDEDADLIHKLRVQIDNLIACQENLNNVKKFYAEHIA